MCVCVCVIEPSANGISVISSTLNVEDVEREKKKKGTHLHTQWILLVPLPIPAHSKRARLIEIHWNLESWTSFRSNKSQYKLFAKQNFAKNWFARRLCAFTHWVKLGGDPGLLPGASIGADKSVARQITIGAINADNFIITFHSASIILFQKFNPIPPSQSEYSFLMRCFDLEFASRKAEKP